MEKEKLEEYYYEKPWSLMYVIENKETKQKVKELCETEADMHMSIRKIVSNTGPEALHNVFLTMVFQLLLNEVDPTSFIKHFSHAVLCRYAYGNLEAYYKNRLLADAWKIIEYLDDYKETCRAYKRIDWNKVKEFTEKVSPIQTYMRHWIKYCAQHGRKRFEEEFRKLFEGFDKEFLHDLALIIENIVLQNYIQALDEHTDDLHQLYHYYPGALDVDEFIKTVENEANKKKIYEKDLNELVELLTVFDEL